MTMMTLIARPQVSELQLLASTPAGLATIAHPGWRYARHLQVLNQALIAVSLGRIRRLMVFMPPRHGKSQLVSETFPAWYIGTHPEHRVIAASYGATLAESFGRKARDLLTEYGPSLYGVTVSSATHAADRWDLHKHRGGMNTVGVGGAMTGMGASVLIIDDPLKNWEEAQSETVRDAIYDWYVSTARTRLTPRGAVILVMTRWHHDDLAGRLLKAQETGQGDRWHVLSMPALAESPDDALGREIGTALWPEQFDSEQLAATRAASGGRVWTALYQQRPSPESGATFQRPWFAHRYRELPNTLARRVMAVDSAFKTGVGSDFSVIATWGATAADYYALNVWRDRVEFPDLVRAILDQYARYRPDVVLVEDAASGQSAIQTLRRETNLPIVAVKPQGSKQSRADSVSPLFEAGKVHLPESADWLADFIEEHVSFPFAAHDDMVDTTSMALARLKPSQRAAYAPNVYDLDDVSDGSTSAPLSVPAATLTGFTSPLTDW